MKAGYDEVVKILIAAGADLNIAASFDITGYTAIRIAKRVSYMMFTILFIYKQQVSTTFFNSFQQTNIPLQTCKSSSEESFYHIQ